MQFAIEELKFAPDHIILHGWSIGGFAVSWAAMSYPNVKAVVS
jgi:dipeptidyl aminopeptidase/acylaminoacyl peptidase